MQIFLHLFGIRRPHPSLLLSFHAWLAMRGSLHLFPVFIGHLVSRSVLAGSTTLAAIHSRTHLSGSWGIDAPATLSSKRLILLFGQRSPRLLLVTSRVCLLFRCARRSRGAHDLFPRHPLGGLCSLTTLGLGWFVRGSRVRLWCVLGRRPPLIVLRHTAGGASTYDWAGDWI